MQARTKFLDNMEGGEFRHLLPTLAISIAAHVILFLFIMGATNYMPVRRYHSSPVIDVNLVSLPLPAASSAPEHPASMKTPPPVQKQQKMLPKSKVMPVVHPEPEKVPSQAVSVAPAKNKSKTSLKKKTFKPREIVKNAIKRIETEAEQSRPRVLQEAIESLKTKVENQQAPVVSQDVQAKGSREKSGKGYMGGGGASQNTALEQIDIYKVELTYYIEKNWAFSEQMAGGNTELEAVLVIKIMPDGQISDTWFEKKSGNSYFDDSAYKAVAKSNPLPPLPAGFLRPYFNVGLIFTPSGLR